MGAYSHFLSHTRVDVMRWTLILAHSPQQKKKNNFFCFPPLFLYKTDISIRDATSVGAVCFGCCCCMCVECRDEICAGVTIHCAVDSGADIVHVSRRRAT